MDVEAYPIDTSTKDTSVAPSSICPAVGMATCTDDGSACAAFAYNVTATPRCAMP